MTAGVAKLAGVERVVVCTPPDRDGARQATPSSPPPGCAASTRSTGSEARSRSRRSPTGQSHPEGLEDSRARAGSTSRWRRGWSRGTCRSTSSPGRRRWSWSGTGRRTRGSAAWDLVGQAEHGEDSLCGLVTWDARLAQEGQGGGRQDISPALERREYVQGAPGAGVRGRLQRQRRRGRAGQRAGARAPGADDGRPRGLLREGRERRAGPLREVRALRGERLLHRDGPRHPHRGVRAAARSGLSVLDFVKLSWVVEGTKAGSEGGAPVAQALAEAEGLPNHYRSAESRFKR